MLSCWRVLSQKRPVWGNAATSPPRLLDQISIVCHRRHFSQKSEEARPVPAATEGTGQLMAELIYGAGLRGHACVALRVRDINLVARTITPDGIGHYLRSTGKNGQF